MNILTPFIESLKTLSHSIYLNQVNLEPLILSDALPVDLQEKLTTPEITDLIETITLTSTKLNELLLPINNSFKQRTFKSKSTMEQYAKFIIDDKPIVDRPEITQLSFEDILMNNPKLKPVRRHKPFEYTGSCPHCSAPHDYIYSHTKTQFMCNVCRKTHTLKSTYSDEIIHRCPHCEYKLSLHHDRNHYNVLICQNHQCSFYLKNTKLVESGEGEHLRVDKRHHKLRYTFRLFDFKLDDIKDKLPYYMDSKVNLDKIHHSKYTLGLILSYAMNYGLSLRKVSQIMKELHDIEISHQTISNYIEAVASITESLNMTHNYELSDTLSFDETYVKVLGKNKYVFFGSDTTHKIITSYRIFSHRTTKEAVTTLYESFKKYKQLPENLNVVTDGNPIYNAAQVFFQMEGINFNLHQVIGVKNNDPISTIYRPFKQVEERLNRTFKQNYYGMNGFGSLRKANVYMSLYVSFFNFLRNHSSLGGKPPVLIEEVNKEHLMPNKWNALIKYTIDKFRHPDFH